MSETQQLTAWLSLCERLMVLPELGDAERPWLLEVLDELRQVTGAQSVVCLLPGEAGSWEQFVAVNKKCRRAEELRGEPGGLIGALQAGLVLDGAAGLRGRHRSRHEGSDGEAHTDRGTRGGELDSASEPAVGRPVSDPLWDGFEGVGLADVCGTPLRLRPRRGALMIIGQPEAGLPFARPRIAQLGRLITKALRNRDRVGNLDEKVITDELTGVFNYRFLRTALRRELRRASRFRHPLSVLMLDVDHLKEYNDRFGHLSGSQVLKTLADVVRGGVRDIDLLAKYGGDEFLAILPLTEKAGAEVVADRLRRRVAEYAFAPLERGAMTCSIGVATYPADADQPEALVAAADQALFAAKRQGRNRVVAA